MVNRSSRNKACQILKRFALGRITDCDCENAFTYLWPDKDGVLFALYRTVFEISGDTDKSLAYIFLRGSEMRKRVCRWILFLKTDLEYEWPEDRLAPGIRDFYNPNFFDKLFCLEARIIRSNQKFISQGDYQVWPFFRDSDFTAAKLACAQKRMTSRTP